MRVKASDRYLLSAPVFGSLCSYEISGEYMVARLAGLFPVRRIHLGAVFYLRLATPTEPSPLFLLFNWAHFLPRRRAKRPVYVVQTRSGRRIFIKLDSAAHFKLRRAIGRHAVAPVREAA